ncbi:MAG: glutamate racemase [Spirochaeta sp.]|jgi:glutamate racemase|nr:glutamate racemase [Spirochaeta sp.]
MILFFDSGIGGLSYLDEFRRRNPDTPVLYLADQAFFPYGNRPPHQVRERVVSLILAVRTQYPVELVVLACNTASVVALEATRRHVELPVVGVVPAVKPAVSVTETNHIAVLATANTVTDPYTDDLVRQFGGLCRVTRLGLPRLVVAAEASICDGSTSAITEVVTRDVKPSLPATVDTIVLACTHFIRIRDDLARLLGPDRKIVDSLDGVVRRISWVIETKGITVAGDPRTPPLFLNTAPLDDALACLPFEQRHLHLEMAAG